MPQTFLSAPLSTGRNGFAASDANRLLGALDLPIALGLLLRPAR